MAKVRPNDADVGPRRAIAIAPDGGVTHLHFQGLADALATMHRVRDDQRPLIALRLKYLSARDFPSPKPRRGRGKAVLGMDETLKLAFVFELLNAGVAPTRAIRLARTDWPVIAARIARAWRGRDAATIPGRLVRFGPRAMAEMGASEPPLGTPLSEVIAEDAPAADMPRVMLVVDVARMVAKLRAALTTSGSVACEPAIEASGFDRAMSAYADATLRAAAPASGR